MAFESIDLNTIKVGDPITRDLWVKIKDNFDSHQTSINNLLTAIGTVSIINGDVDFVGYSALEPNIFHYKARQNFSLNDFRVQLFSKQGVTTGNLTLDLQKSIDTNDSNFSTVLTADLEFDFSVDPDYEERVATINASLNSVTVGDVLRVKVLNVPFGFNGKILMSIGGQ
jgi:hypothetical protein